MRSGELAALYHELAQLLRTGLTLSRAAETLLRAPLPAATRAILTRLRSESDRGSDLAAAIEGVPPLDRAVLAAGESSGHLDRCLTVLAQFHSALDSVRRSALRRAAYPLFLIHFGALILGIPSFILGGGLRGYLLGVLAVVLPVYAILIGGVILARIGLRLGQRSAAIDRLLDAIPIAGSTRRHLALSRFCMAYGTQLEAGIPVLRALPAAADVAGSARIAAAVHRALPEIQRGATPGPLLGPYLPEALARGIVVGEETGTLDQELDRWATWHRERGLSGLEVLGEWIPRLLYLAVAGILAWRIIAAYSQVLAGLSKAMDL